MKVHKVSKEDWLPVCGADPERTPFHFAFIWPNVTCAECLKRKGKK